MRIQYKLFIAAIAILLSFLMPEVEIYLAFALILIFGIPHGATDHILNNLIKDQKIDSKPRPVFLIYYLSVIILYACLWYFLPAISLLVFILISAFHFGETQLNDLKGKTLNKYLNYFFWGLSALLIIFQPHLEKVAAIISPYLISESLMSWIQSYFIYILGFSLFVSIANLINAGLKNGIHQIIELVIIFLVANFSSLLFSFAVFFAFWHSRDATFHQINKIRDIVGKFNFKEWLKLAFPYTMISLVGIVLIIIFSDYFQLEIPSITLFFVLVALITLPHVFVMSTFYKIPHKK